MNSGFLWKLTENYLNAIMVAVLVLLVIEYMTSGDRLYIILTLLWLIAIPFLGTFIDMRSNQKIKR